MSFNSVEPLFSVARRVEHVLFSRVFFGLVSCLGSPSLELKPLRRLFSMHSKGFCSGIICPIGFDIASHSVNLLIFKCSQRGLLTLRRAWFGSTP